MHKGGLCMAGKKDSQPLQSFNILQLDTHGQRDISKGGDYTWGLWHGVEGGGLYTGVGWVGEGVIIYERGLYMGVYSMIHFFIQENDKI